MTSPSREPRLSGPEEDDAADPLAVLLRAHRPVVPPAPPGELAALERRVGNPWVLRAMTSPRMWAAAAVLALALIGVWPSPQPAQQAAVDEPEDFLISAMAAPVEEDGFALTDHPYAALLADE